MASRLEPIHTVTEQRHHGDQLAEYRAWIGPHLAMQHLGIHSLSALYRLIREHRLPFGRVGRCYRFRRDHLDRWVEVRGVEALSVISRKAL